MKQEKIKRIIKKEIKKITELSGDIADKFDKETIHDFRVTVKTLRSFLRLLRFNVRKPGMKIPEKFKRLYHIVGAIRDVQLEIENISGMQAELPHYLDRLHQMLDRQKSEWKKHHSKKVLHKLDKRLTGLNYEPLHPDNLKNFFDGRMAIVTMITQRVSPTDNQIHTIRKKIKDIIYTSGLSQHHWRSAHKQIRDLPVKQMDALTKIIGDYNDNRITLKHLSAFTSNTIDKDEKEAIKNLRDKETAKLKAKKKSIVTAARKFVGSATV